MQRRTAWGIIAWFLLATAGLSITSLADGIILPDAPERGWLSIETHDVTVTARDGIVTTRIDQVFHNGTGRDVEGRYVFPLPPGAIVSEFTMWVDGQALEARLLPAEEARAIYEDYVRRTIDPALLEYIGRDTLSARIFPIPAGGKRRIEIAYSELLSAEDGVYRYRYPLSTERFSAHPLDRVTIALDLETSAPLAAVYSPTHDLAVTRVEETAATGWFEASNVLPGSDFVLYYSVSQAEMAMTLLTYRAPGEDGVFMLIANPPSLASSDDPLPKDLIFVLDQSGSMGGEKIEQAKEALQFILRNLNPEDRFAVLAFSDITESLHTELQPVSSESIAESAAWVSRIEAGGGTNIDEALSLGFSLFEPTSRPRFLVFLTDGEPTVGEENPAIIAEHARERNHANARVFVFGVGYDVNTVLLDQLAREHRGTTTYIVPGENLESRVSSFYRKIASPVLADTALAIEGIEAYDLFPRQLPDLFRGTELLVLGRYRGDGAARITVSGTAQGVAAAYTTIHDIPGVQLEASFLPRLWAGRKIAHLLDQIRLYGEDDELVDAIIELSRRFGIITPYTSFLVEEPGQTAEEMADAVRSAAAAPASGASAVQASSALKTLAESETTQAGVAGVRIVEDRVYFDREGVWTDSGYEDEETIDIAWLSPAYFDLVDVLPWIAPHLAIGESVIIRVGDRFIRIAEDGITELTTEWIDALAE